MLTNYNTEHLCARTDMKEISVVANMWKILTFAK